MKVILVDDENLALCYLEYQLMNSGYGPIEIMGKFTNPFEAKQFAMKNDSLQVVFLDIHIPEISGLEWAEQALEWNPHLHIVFVTAYDQFAISAFELNALDYLLKPVKRERLVKTLQRIEERLRESTAPLHHNKAGLRVTMLQQLLIEEKPGQLSPLRWRTTKAQELFVYLLQHRGQIIRKTTLADLLWQGFEPSRANSQLYTAIYHIRKTLEPFAHHLEIASTSEGYMLSLRDVTLDVEEWEGRIGANVPITAETVQEHEQSISLYKGDYLEECDYWWIEGERHRLKMLWIRTVLQLASWYASCAMYDQAIEKYVEVTRRHPQAEEAHFALMKLYADMGQSQSVHRQYEQLLNVLWEDLGAMPSHAITNWYQQWKSNKE
ncbi:response regulator [Paenibacillus silviterrae]|uniref:response regulator n=1 Tax=Paenibacillus silviterrae TaxID=3242194 RepID=UPI002542E3A9|nr:response regulator [Paenibacillus chinjuensis]